jgi:hypothetical protein
MKKLLFTIFAFAPVYFLSAQVNADSLDTETTLEELFTVCNSSLPESNNQGEIIFERLAPYILYVGTDATKNNKSGCDYNKVEDRKLVDKMGYSLKSWLDKISDFKVVKYQKTKKDNLDWHIIILEYKPLNGGKNKVFSFIKVKDKFLLSKFE